MLWHQYIMGSKDLRAEMLNLQDWGTDPILEPHLASSTFRREVLDILVSEHELGGGTGC